LWRTKYEAPRDQAERHRAGGQLQDLAPCDRLRAPVEDIVIGPVEDDRIEPPAVAQPGADDARVAHHIAEASNAARMMNV
jgi:hypothetical protein